MMRTGNDANKVQNLETASQAKQRRHDRGLVVIGVFKLFKGLLFILLGIGALKLIHKDIADVVMRWLIDMRFDPESKFVNLVLDKVAMLDEHRLRLISIAIFCYAGLDFIEGTGLVLEKTWAEFLTLILTASFLPWEFFEILRHPTWVKAVLTLVNVVVVVYLVFYVKRQLRGRNNTHLSKVSQQGEE
jgi:uncharacterized membrane protein (DUF2068 family)